MTTVKRHFDQRLWNCAPLLPSYFRTDSLSRERRRRNTDWSCSACGEAALGLEMTDIGCWFASAVECSAHSCTAAYMSVWPKGTDDSCYGYQPHLYQFVSALSTVSYLIEGGEPPTVLMIVSSRSLGLNPKQKALVFSDGLQPLFEATKEDKGIIASMQRTWSGGHDTWNSWWFDSLSSKCTLKQPRRISCLIWRKRRSLPSAVLFQKAKNSKRNPGISKDAVDYIPHPASRALPLVMDKWVLAKINISILSAIMEIWFQLLFLSASLCTGS